MVDVVLLQSASYVAAAIGVCVAAFYYAFNLRETSRNRKISYTTNFMQQFYSKEFGRRYIDLLGMTWKDHDEYMEKYDSRVNPENFADRWSFMGMLDVLGHQYKAGLIDLQTIYELTWAPIIMTWIKFKPIIDEYKKTDYGEDQFANFELIANALWKIMMRRDPAWKDHAMSGYAHEDIVNAFSK